MRYFCLTCDYDGTIARDGRVPPSTVEALKRVSASGRKLVLATGRELADLLAAFPDISLFDRVVAENGALLYRPVTREQRLLADPPPREFVKELLRRGIDPVSVGQCIVATWHPHESVALDVIRTFGLELQVTFNKNAVMILPSGVNKGTGLEAALEELGLSPHNVVGVGDAENDHAFLGLCECGVAVENALPAVKERADFVTVKSHGAGVEELVERLLSDDLLSLGFRLKRHHIRLGHRENGEAFEMDPYSSRLLVAGPSGSGKSTAVSAIVERLIQNQYQVCLIDPEGDYDGFAQLVTLGAPDRIPGVSEILEVLETRQNSVSVNLLGIPPADRPPFFQGLLSRLQEVRSRTGRPHWIIIDEAHHLLPVALDSAPLTVPSELTSFALITVHPNHVAQVILNSINGVIAVGPNPQDVFAEFSSGSGKILELEHLPKLSLELGQVLVWPFGDSQEPFRVTVKPAETELRRHRRKYAAGELGEDKSFYFRGPEQKLNLRAQNMNMFVQLAEGVDDETWMYHLRSADYSRWLRNSVKNPTIAEEVAIIENDKQLGPGDSRSCIIESIRKHYTDPA